MTGKIVQSLRVTPFDGIECELNGHRLALQDWKSAE